MPSVYPAHPKGPSSPHFPALVYCDQTAGWINMLLGTEVGLGTGHIVLDGDPAPSKRGHKINAPNFRN